MPKVVAGQNTTQNTAKVIECSPVMLGTSVNYTSAMWVDPPKEPNLIMVGTQGNEEAPYVNKSLEMNANLFNAKLKSFQYFHKSTPDSYNLRDFSSDYMLWQYG